MRHKLARRLAAGFLGFPTNLLLAGLILSLPEIAKPQQVIPLPVDQSNAQPQETYQEKQYYSNAWKTEVVANVTKPSLTVYKPLPWMANGAAVVVCPGGGFMALSIQSEGIQVAEWLAQRGMTAFVLKYRLVHTGEDATTEFQQLVGNREQLTARLSSDVPLAIADGLQAMTYVKAHAADWGVLPDKVGIVGFSAGGTVATGVALRYTPQSRPLFAAPIYPAASMFRNAAVPADAPPMFIAAATNDNLNLAGDAVALYQQWTAAHKPAELHMYELGSHGFGMRKQGLPSDEWIDRFWDWLQLEGVLPKAGERAPASGDTH